MADDAGGFEFEDSLGQCEIRPIQGVKSLDPGLKVQFLAYREVPGQGRVDRSETWSAQNVETGIAILEHSCPKQDLS